VTLGLLRVEVLFVQFIFSVGQDGCSKCTNISFTFGLMVRDVACLGELVISFHMEYFLSEVAAFALILI
jgi:hypothetical protein